VIGAVFKGEGRLVLEDRRKPVLKNDTDREPNRRRNNYE